MDYNWLIGHEEQTSESVLRGLARSLGRSLSPAELREALQTCPGTAAGKTPGARRYDNVGEWLSDCDGMMGYRMDLLYRRTEIKLLCLEATRALACLLGKPIEYLDFDLEAAWDLLLEAQRAGINHADGEAQKRYVAALRRVNTQADAAWEREAGAVVGHDDNGGWATVFNLYPTARTMFTCIRSDGAIAVYDGSRRVPSQFIDGDRATAIELDMEGLGIKHLRVESDGPGYVCEPVTDTFAFENKVMSLRVRPNGCIESMCSLENGQMLRLGNALRGHWRNADGAEVLLRGEDIPMQTKVIRGEFGHTLHMSGHIEGVGVAMVMYLPHNTSRRVEIMLDISFDESVRETFIASGGALWLEWQSTMERPDVRCDRPFGWVNCSDGEALYSSNGVAITQQGSGLIFDHQGVTRSYIRNGTLYTLLAKGGEGADNDAPAGELDARSPDAVERTLWRYFYAIDIADNDSPEDLFGRIASYQFPMLPIRTDAPSKDWILYCLPKGLIPTALFERDGDVFLRGWNPVEQSASDGMKPFGIFEIPVSKKHGD